MSATTDEVLALADRINVTAESIGAQIEKFSRDAFAEIDRLRAALSRIAEMQSEEDEWDAVNKFHVCQRIAKEAL